MASPLKFYYHPTPNPSKVALFLEESEQPYEAIPIDILRGDQHSPEFGKLNPNRKVPVIVDGDTVIFDSSAILLYLARKTGLFQGGSSDAAQAGLLSWLMLIASGVGPFTGQSIHFRRYAPPLPYAKRRYDFEVERHWTIVDERLSDNRYLMGDHYTIADMSLWGWCRGLNYLLGDEAWIRFPHAGRLFAEINARPAAERVKQLIARHDFKQAMDGETRSSLFRHGSVPA